MDDAALKIDSFLTESGAILLLLLLFVRLEIYISAIRMKRRLRDDLAREQEFLVLLKIEIVISELTCEDDV